jgi:hypothetical protein
VTQDDPELEYLRRVEDLFASSRGLPHILSPKDVHLVRTWFADGVPLSAVSAGVTEVVERKRADSDGDVVVSLTYCRHAVRRHARRIAAARTGASDGDSSESPNAVSGHVHRVCDALVTRAGLLRTDCPGVTEVLLEVADRLRTAADTDRATVDELAFALEAEMLRRCYEALPEPDRTAVDERVRARLDAASTPEAARTRVGVAHRDRMLREDLGLPRLDFP